MPLGFHELTDQITAEIRYVLSQVSEEQVLALRTAFLSEKRIFVAGRGRSGLQMQGAAMRLMHLGLQVHVIGDVTTPAITENDLLLIGSGSGSTASLVQYAKKAGSVGAKVALVTTNDKSVIAEMADYMVCLSAPTPKVKEERAFTSIQPMGSLFEQCLGILLDSIILQCMEVIDKGGDEMFSLHANLE